jgi:hypothetical protein
MKKILHLALSFGLIGMAGGTASAVQVALPDTSQNTTLTATVSEQADVSVPAGISFNVTDVASSTDASAAAVSITKIVLATATKQLRLSVQANAAGFTPPAGGGAGAVTWSATDVSWNAPSWTNGTGAAGTLSSGAFNTVSTSDAAATSMTTNGLVFTLAGKSNVNRSGSHTLNITWKVESIGS